VATVSPYPFVAFNRLPREDQPDVPDLSASPLDEGDAQVPVVVGRGRIVYHLQVLVLAPLVLPPRPAPTADINETAGRIVYQIPDKPRTIATRDVLRLGGQGRFGPQIVRDVAVLHQGVHEIHEVGVIH